MKKIFTFFVLFLLVMACNEPLQEEFEADLKSGNIVERTIKFQRSTGTMEVLQDVQTCPYGLQMLVSGGGNATFLGNFSVINTFCLDTDLNPIPPIMGELTAANGDKIFTMVIDYRFDEVTMIHYYDYMILPGMATGRFEGATGYINMYGTVDYASMTWDLKGEGKISF